MKKMTLFFRLLFSKSLKHRNKLTKNLDNWKTVYETEIRNAQLKPNQLTTIGQSLFLTKLEQVISDLDITEQEKADLDEIVKTFSLADNYIKSAKASVNKSAVTKLIKKQYDDKVLTEAEKTFIVDFANYLQLDSATVEKIRVNIASSIFKTALNEKLKDKKLSPQEETELNQALRDLQLDDATIKSVMPQKSVKELAYAKLLWQLDNGVFTTIPNPPITLKKWEECYLAFPAKLWEQKTVNKGYKHAGHGVSFNVTKGVRYRVGSGRSVPVKEEVTIKHPGSLFLTNYKVVFSAGKQSFNVSFDKLLTFDVYSNGIGFVINGWTYLVELGSQEIELFATGLASSIRNYFNEENEVLQKAKKEIEDSETFINISHEGKK